MEIITGILIFAAVSLIFLIIWVNAKKDSVGNKKGQDKILTLTEHNFKEKTGNKVVLVDFWAEWCSPCRMMAPVLNEIALDLDGKYFIGKVNVEQFQSLSQKYRVQSIPTMILFKNSKEVKRFVGIKPKEFLIQQLQNVK